MQISTDHIRYLQLQILIIYIIKTLSIRYRRREHATESLLTIKQFRLPIEISKSTLIYLNKTKSLLTRVGNGTGWDEIYQSQSCPIYTSEIKKNVSLSFLYFFWTKIYPDPVQKDMGFWEILSQLKKFSSLVCNETRWDGICQSQSRPVYVRGMKKMSHSHSYIFLWDKNISKSHPK